MWLPLLLLPPLLLLLLLSPPLVMVLLLVMMVHLHLLHLLHVLWLAVLLRRPLLVRLPMLLVVVPRLALSLHHHTHRRPVQHALVQAATRGSNAVEARQCRGQHACSARHGPAWSTELLRMCLRLRLCLHLRLRLHHRCRCSCLCWQCTRHARQSVWVAHTHWPARAPSLREAHAHWCPKRA